MAPYAEPEYAKLRGPIASEMGEATKLDASFALHPALVETAKMYKAGEALFVHAVATAYRDRSHFDGQNVLETGGRAPYELKDGWMNRLTSLLPKQKAAPIALAPTVPMALRGRARRFIGQGRASGRNREHNGNPAASRPRPEGNHVAPTASSAVEAGGPLHQSASSSTHPGQT